MITFYSVLVSSMQPHMKNLFALFAILFSCRATAQEYKQLPMWDTRLSFEQRVDDLVKRLTLEEKAAQMLNAAPAIPRLGIPAYDWWNEVLHGVARTPFRTTVYPQAIGMAATWDTNSLKLMARQSALEGRAVYNKAKQLGRSHERYMGLTYWTPNINIFRDPRWGRGQETYGEDPFLTGKLGSAFVRGLQGNNPKYLLTAACAKHYAVHSGPEPSRHSDNFNVTDYELWDTYLPAFKELIADAKVAGVMCAYNALRTQPCCANDLLMNDILRRKWNFTGYVTSDCWALDDFFKYHKTHKNATDAAVDALLHGTDVECGVAVYKKLVDAVKAGTVAEAQIDASVQRLFMIRYRLGMFDPDEAVPYANTGAEMLEAASHCAHALHMARQSIVLLKNQNNLLPLSKKLKKIAVIGPNAANSISVLGNYNGIPSKIVTVVEGIRQKLGAGAEVIYEEAIQFTGDTLFVADENTAGYGGGFTAQYFTNKNLEGSPRLTQQVSAINFFFSEGQPPAAGMPATHYSVRYTTSFKSDKAETIIWQMEGDDGYRLLVNDSVVVDAWSRNRWGAKTFRLNVEKGKTYKVILEHWQNEGNAQIRLQRGNFVKTDFDALAGRLSDADAIVFAGGISPQLEGEEMPVNYPGFNGGDRSSILLPAVQTALLKKLHATGKPVIFVMMTGSALATPWESANLPAILNAWYGGQSAGSAIADVLFGDYNPAGRLPVTFYGSNEDLPDFKDYSMQNRTYRYFTGKPLYPFGFGLSYTRFSYSVVKGPQSVKAKQPITISTTVTNTGGRDGEEVVQCYIKWPDGVQPAPRLALRGFQRIALEKGETKTVVFKLSPADLELPDNAGNYYQPAGQYTLYIGGGQPDVDAAGSATPVVHKIKIVP